MKLLKFPKTNNCPFLKKNIFLSKYNTRPLEKSVTKKHVRVSQKCDVRITKMPYKLSQLKSIQKDPQYDPKKL